MADYSGALSYAEMMAEANRKIESRPQPAYEHVKSSSVQTYSVRRPSDTYEIALGPNCEEVAQRLARALKDLTGDRWTVKMVHEIEEEYYP